MLLRAEMLRLAYLSNEIAYFKDQDKETIGINQFRASRATPRQKEGHLLLVSAQLPIRPE